MRLEIIGWFFLITFVAKIIIADDRVQFSRDIRPILSEACFQCHGPDEKTREADLTLSTKQGLLGNSLKDKIVVPGKPMESELYKRLVSHDKETLMPPLDSGKSISPVEIELIRKWILQGAHWQGHWAYIAPRKPQLPETGASPFIKNNIDRFVLKKLVEKRLSPSQSADRATLIRRLSFDLNGLPPSLEEVKEYVTDQRPNAYERLVDRLLAREEFGERMAMYWLDLVRYADTNGIHGDNHRDVYLYRDYVIQSFNKNIPFDQFTREQLAGDLIEQNSMQTRIASGYNRLLMTTREGGAQPKEYIAKYASDRVRNASTAWLGSTMMCAECHNHKYDPFTMKDFYSFAAFFSDLQETAVGVQQSIKVPRPSEIAKIEEIDQQVAEVRKEFVAKSQGLKAKIKQWEKKITQGRLEWNAINQLKVLSKSGSQFQVSKEGKILAVGNKKPDEDVYSITFHVKEPVSGIRMEVLPHPSLPAKGPGRADNGNFVLNQIDISHEGKPYTFSKATATYRPDLVEIDTTIDNKPNSGWDIMPQAGMPAVAVFQASQNIPAGKIKISLHQNYGRAHILGHFRFFVTNSPRPVKVIGEDTLPHNIRELIRINSATRTPQQQQKIADYYISIDPELKPIQKRIQEFEYMKKKVNDSMQTMLVSQAVTPRTVRVLPRGNWLDESGEITPPKFPQFLSNPSNKQHLESNKPLTRLDLANWITNSRNPLTSRVFVNRMWKLLFGRGLVNSVDDFGAQGDLPTHPLLLDWLATEFIENSWNIKLLIRMIVTSGTYRQSSQATPQQLKLDPYNRWLARQGRFRMDAEMIRDNALAVSGLLVKKIGGRSVKPYQPSGYWKHLNFPKRIYKHDRGENQYRRGLYSYWCRTFLHPSLVAFDAPTREECTVDRPRSNTPLQALVLLNDPTFVESSRVFAERILKSKHAETENRIQFAFQQILGRKARPEEINILVKLYNRHHTHFAKHEKATAEILSVGEKPMDSELPPDELAAWTSITRVLLNLHETINRY